MANSWLRLWHDMPNDPKWRTIARVSKQPISAVIAVYIHILVIASNATERGRTQNVCSEDLASALDLEVEQIEAILEAMQGRVLDGEMVSGWAKRQVEREDGSAERAKAWRLAQKEAKQTQANATERKQTPDKDTDTDTDKNKNITPLAMLTAMGVDESLAKDWLKVRKEKKQAPTQTAFDRIKAHAEANGMTFEQAVRIAVENSWAGFKVSWMTDHPSEPEPAELKGML